LRLNSALKLVNNWEARLSFFNPSVDQQYIDEAALLEESLIALLEAIWPLLEGNKPFVRGWYHEAIAEHLEATYYGNINYLLINQPPRTSKSTMLIALFIWSWIKDPSLQFLCLSFGLRLSIRDSVRCRRILTSPWFKKRWGHKVKLSDDVNNKLRFDNTSCGYRMSTSIHGTGTGDGGDFILIDDANNAGDTESETKRTSTNEWCDSVLSTRLNNLETGRIIAVQQRLHAQDHSGHTLAAKMPGLVHLCIPMEFEVNRRCVTIPLKSTQGKPWKDPRTIEGQVLCPFRFNPKSLAKMKANLKTEYRIAGQLQQRPSPSEGGLFKKQDFQWWKEGAPPRCEFVLQSWDTAFSKSATASFSACTTWGLFKNSYGVPNIILLSLWKGRLENPEVRRMMIRLAKNYYDTNLDSPAPEDYIIKPDMILIEGKANGSPLMQDLNRAGLIVNRFDPVKHGGGDKVARARAISHIIEAGLVWMPAMAPHFTRLRPFADQFVEACASFPNDDEAKDLVDSMSQALIKFRLNSMIDHPDDAYITEEFNPNYGKKYY
jgi:predicted phage terminase large subunit-like protein